MRIVKVALLGVLGAAALAPAAAAQVEPAVKPQTFTEPAAEPIPVWSGQFDASLLAVTGNSDTKAFGAGVVALYNQSPWRVEGKASFTSASADGIATARRFISGIRAERDLGGWWGAYGGFGWARDTFAGYSSLTTIEAGFLYRAVVQPKHTLTFSAGVAQSFEKRVPPNEDRNFLGGKLGANYKYKISENSELFEEAGFLWNFEESPDWRFYNNAGITAQVTKTIGIKIANELFYRHEPIPGRESTDSVFRAGIVAKF